MRLIALDEGDELVDVARVVSEDADPLDVAETGDDVAPPEESVSHSETEDAPETEG